MLVNGDWETIFWMEGGEGDLPVESLQVRLERARKEREKQRVGQLGEEDDVQAWVERRCVLRSSHW